MSTVAEMVNAAARVGGLPTLAILIAALFVKKWFNDVNATLASLVETTATHDKEIAVLKERLTHIALVPRGGE